jgi:hypothetical protein
LQVAAAAFAADVPDHGARLQLTLGGAPDLALTLIPDGADGPVAVVANNGVVSLPLESCRADESCELDALAVVEWTAEDPPQGPLPVNLKVEGLARVPHTDKRCGLPANAVILTATPPVLRSRTGIGVTPRQAHDATELVQHVTVRFPSGIDTATETDSPVVTRGHLAIDPDPNPPQTGFPATSVPGAWLRVTPDDGGRPVLDVPVPVRYPVLPADATFPMDPACLRPCERGFWIQVAVYDPAGRRFGDADTAVYAWSFDASAFATGAARSGPSAIVVDLDATDLPAPPSLVLRGTGPAFDVDGDHPATTLAIDAAAPAQGPRPFGDVLGEATIVFQVTTVPLQPLGASKPFISNGHYIGDGSDDDDKADTGGWGGVATVPSPPGRPFGPCPDPATACAARTGLVLRRYDDVFDSGAPTPPYEVRWAWTVVGAPPGATVTVAPIPGETLDATGIGLNPAMAGALLGATVMGGVLILWLARRRNRPPAVPR